jgi:hypothetical protein
MADSQLSKDFWKGHVIDRLKVPPAVHRSCSDVSATNKTGEMAPVSLLSTPKLDKLREISCISLLSDHE